MRITRREFLKYCSVAAGALGLSASDLLKLEKALASVNSVRVIWLMGATCSGCSTSLLNSVYYTTIQDLLLFNPDDEAISLRYHPTVMAASGTLATDAINTTNFDTSLPYVLAVEGAIQRGESGHYCHIGESILGTGLPSPVTMQDAVDYYATRTGCAAILSIGTCASFGGIPSGKPYPTDATGVVDFFKGKYYVSNFGLYRTLRNKTVNIPGCPPNPNWIVGTVATILYNHHNGVSPLLPSRDTLRRPRDYYSERICNNCERFAATSGPGNANFIDNRNPNQIGYDNGYDGKNWRTFCLKYIGCKGSRTKSDCSLKKWHSPGTGLDGVNWCVGAGAPCQGCTQPNFPDRFSPFHYIR